MSNSSKSVSLPDEDWLFLQDEFGTDSATKLIKIVIKKYKELKREKDENENKSAS